MEQPDMNSPIATHLVVDLETLSTDKVQPVILEYGISKIDFYWNSFSVEHSFHNHLELQQQFNNFRLVDKSTIDWWAKKGRSLESFIDDPRHKEGISITDMLDEISKLYAYVNAQAIWSFGSNFDIEILENAYKRNNRKQPWHYRDVRCERTLEALFPLWTTEIQVSEITHSALQDSYDQAQRIAHIIQKLRDAKLPVNIESMKDYSYS